MVIHKYKIKRKICSLSKTNSKESLRNLTPKQSNPARLCGRQISLYKQNYQEKFLIVSIRFILLVYTKV